MNDYCLLSPCCDLERFWVFQNVEVGWKFWKRVLKLLYCFHLSCPSRLATSPTSVILSRLDSLMLSMLTPFFKNKVSSSFLLSETLWLRHSTFISWFSMLLFSLFFELLFFPSTFWLPPHTVALFILLFLYTFILIIFLLIYIILLLFVPHLLFLFHVLSLPHPIFLCLHSFPPPYFNEILGIIWNKSLHDPFSYDEWIENFSQSMTAN